MLCGGDTILLPIKRIFECLQAISSLICCIFDAVDINEKRFCFAAYAIKRKLSFWKGR